MKDHVKQAVVDAVRSALRKQTRVEIDLQHCLGIHPEVEIQDVGNLETLIRVRTDEGPRYFLVRVSEKF